MHLELDGDLDCGHHLSPNCMIHFGLSLYSVGALYWHLFCCIGKSSLCAQVLSNIVPVRGSHFFFYVMKGNWLVFCKWSLSRWVNYWSTKSSWNSCQLDQTEPWDKELIFIIVHHRPKENVAPLLWINYVEEKEAVNILYASNTYHLEIKQLMAGKETHRHLHSGNCFLSCVTSYWLVK